MKLTRIALATAGLLLAGQSFAAILSGDFRTESNLPDHRNGAPLVYQHLGATVDNSVELNDSHFAANPDNWRGGVVFMDLNPTTNVLTLFSQDHLDFQTFSAKISNLTFSAGEKITGFSLLSNNLTTGGVAPSLSFTGNSLAVNYDNRPGIFNFTSGTASFQVITAPVPEPETYALMGLGLVGLFAARKKKSA